MIIDIIRKKLEDNATKKEVIKIGYIKEILQSEVLDFVYRNTSYKDLIFYGGTAMRFLLGLNRFSEDLDFIGMGFKDFEQLCIQLQNYFHQQYNLEVEYKLQKFRITLKFRNFLQYFNMQYGNSNDLYLKIEISDHFDFCRDHIVQYYPVIFGNKSMLISSLDQPTLFATKLNAIFYRQWVKNKNSKNIKVKGRDFYDLFWYLQKGIQPNINCIKNIKNIKELKEKLSNIINNTNFKEVIQDIENFVEDDVMISFLQEHGAKRILEKINEWKE